MSTRAGSRISSDRVAKTPVTAPGGKAVTGWLTDEAITARPVRFGRTEEEKRKAAAEDELEILRAARTVTRYTMLAAHGCTGRGCRKRAHGADAAFRDEVLDMLQLKPGP